MVYVRRDWELEPVLVHMPGGPALLPRLLLRHLGFLIALFVLQTAALAAYPDLPDWWHVQDRKAGTPFDLTLLFSCMGLAFVQVFTNRRLLDRAHREFSK